MIHKDDDRLGREGWTFQVTAAWLLEHARAQHETSKERLAHWKAELKKRQNKLKEEGIDYTEAINQANVVSNSTQYYNKPTLDNKLVLSMQEAQNRVTVHENIIKDMSRWEIVLALKPDDTLDLTFDDAEYFNIR